MGKTTSRTLQKEQNRSGKNNKELKLSDKEKLKILLFLLFVSSLTLFSFSGTLKNDFINNYDDNFFMSFVQSLKKLDLNGLKLIFSSELVGNYHPLTVLSLVIDFKFHGMDPYFFHLVNLILHVLNSILVFWLIFVLTSRFEAAAIVSLFFAIHPMHVESVAWICERKDVIYSFFFILSIISYVYYLKRGMRYKFFI